jgi:hypothetical protein
MRNEISGVQGEKCLSILAFSLVAFTALPANAQAVSGNVFGTVTDPSGGAVANAKVTIANVDTNVSTTTNTNDSGNYTATQLAPGNYKITIEKAGFNTFIQENIPVSVSLGTRVDATLTLGQVTQQVTVTEAPPELQSDRAEVDTSLTAGQIEQLPVLNRNFTNLTLLVPGATLNTFQHAATENPQQSTLVNTNSQEFAGTNYHFDGMNNNDSVLGIVMVNPPIDSIGETVIATSNYEPEYTQAGGAVVRMETKSGSGGGYAASAARRPRAVSGAASKLACGAEARIRPEEGFRPVLSSAAYTWWRARTGRSQRANSRAVHCNPGLLCTFL